MSYEIWRAGDGDDADAELSTVDPIGSSGYPGDYSVGRYPQGDDLSQWALRRYLLVRAIGSAVVRTVQWFGIAILVLAIGIWFAGIHWLAVLVAIGAVLVLLFRATLSAVQNQLSGTDRLGPAAADVERLVSRTRRQLRAELHRVGLPGAPWGPAMVGVRVARRSTRAETIRRLTAFDLTQVVPAGTLDELHMLLRRSGRGMR